MNTKTVVLNAKKMNFDGKLDFSILSSQVTVYDDTAPEELLERIQDADVIVTKEMPVSGDLIRQFPDSVKLICEAGTGYSDRLSLCDREHPPPESGVAGRHGPGGGSGRRQGKRHHGLQYPGLQHPESRPDRDHADLKLKLRHAGPDGNACQRQS